MLCFGSAVTLNFPMMLWTAIGPRGVVAVKSSVSIRAPFFVRTCLIEVLRLLVPGRSRPALAEASHPRRVIVSAASN